MRVCFQKLSQAMYRVIALRGDGVSLTISQGRQLSLPHDLAHFIVESELDMKNGFWGCVAQGAIFDGMVVTAGRQKPYARSQSSKIIKRHRNELFEAEDAVRRLTIVARVGKSTSTSSREIAKLNQYYPNGRYKQLTSADSERIISIIRGFTDKWKSLPEEGVIQVHWNERTPKESF